MRSRKVTVLLVSGDDAAVKQFSFSRRALPFAVGALALTVMALIGLTVINGLGGAARAQSALLQHENTLLESELAEMRQRLESLDESLLALSEQDARYRQLAGLDAIDAEIRAVGVGGPGGRSPEQHQLWGLDSLTSTEAYAADFDLNALERRTRLLSESMLEAVDSLEAQRDLMERTPSILPTRGLVSSRFSNARLHPIHNRELPHPGVDLSAPQGTAIMAAAKGRVVRAGRMRGYGLLVEIDHGHGYVTRYGHASELLVQTGQRVDRGDVIARVGRTGIATAPHLHYEVRVNGQARNPLGFILDGLN